MNRRVNHKKLKYHRNKFNSWSSPSFNYLEYNSCEFEESSTTATEISTECEPVKEADDRDSKGRRIILREFLYEDPDLFNSNSKLKQNYGLEWNIQHWKKAGEAETQDSNFDEDQISQRRPNKVQKELNKMLSQPVNMTKAERMMQKMGWQGGALGKHGEGIIEPIAPNASYATKTVGLGQTVKKRKHEMKTEIKEHFDTNVLLYVLDFVKNDSENEIVFDRLLWKNERKRVHNIIEAISSSGSTVSVDFDTVAQMDIAQHINSYNKYFLSTESEGTVPNRYLCLYKEAPEHMYLITPDDLRKEDRDDEDSEEPKDTQEKGKTAELEQDALSNDTSNVENENKPKSKPDEECTIETLLATITEYFLEFISDDNYTEFRFLGPFTMKEINAINIFIAKCTNCDYNENDKLKEAFQNNEYSIDIKEDFNGSTV
ncbi:unnamed protein product [Parnassius mnemosyne]